MIDLPISIDWTRPKPIRYNEDIPHLDGALAGELRMPRCRTCGSEFWPAGPVCPRDFTADLDWVTDPGTGVVNSWVQIHKPYFAGDEVPYVVIQVQLDTGPRLTTSWTGPQLPRIGEPVAVSFRQIADGIALTEFGPPPPHQS